MNKMFNLFSEYDKNPYFKYENSVVVATIIGSTSNYNQDLYNAIKVILLSNRTEKYEFIYDSVCDYLDYNFVKNNFCDFKNDRCIANRKQCTKHDTMGCCYSFKYAGLLDIRLVKDVKLCKYMQNRKCATKNITCKLFTCKYLRGQKIFFDTRKILLLDCFFNKKQHEIIKSNFFRSREEILNKLQEKNYSPYLWYYMFRGYMIKD